MNPAEKAEKEKEKIPLYNSNLVCRSQTALSVNRRQGCMRFADKTVCLYGYCIKLKHTRRYEKVVVRGKEFCKSGKLVIKH